VDEFKARDLEAEMKRSGRNCTKNIDAELKVLIITRVLNLLLQEDDPLNNFSTNVYIETHDGTKWNGGRKQGVKLGQVAALFDKQTLAKLKMECGGIKTLLRNHHQMFVVSDGDLVRIKTTGLELEKDKKRFARTKECLFDAYHPQGCWQTGDACFFIHKNVEK
jgi:hypothetical protein